MPITIGSGTSAIARFTQPVRPSTSISDAGRIIGADDLGKRQMRQRLADQHRAGNGPEERQRLAVEPAEQDRDQAIDEEDAEDPGRDLGFRQSAVRADREDDGDRCGDREQPADESVRGVEHAEIGHGARRSFGRTFDVAEHQRAFTGRLAWLVCGTPRFSDMWEWTQSQRSAVLENTMVARPGRGNGVPSG